MKGQYDGQDISSSVRALNLYSDDLELLSMNVEDLLNCGYTVLDTQGHNIRRRYFNVGDQYFDVEIIRLCKSGMNAIPTYHYCKNGLTGAKQLKIKYIMVGDIRFFPRAF